MLVVILLAVFIGFSVKVPTFNLTSILSQQKYLDELIILFPMAFVLILGEIDISVGSIVCLAGTVAALASNGGMSTPVSVVIGLLIGLACGLINGLICITFTELPPMIITLGTQILFRGIAEILLGSGGSISIADGNFGKLASKIGIVPIAFILIIILAVVSTILAHKTTFGRRVFAMGSNRLTAYYSGINVPGIRLFVYAWLGLAAGACAMFLNAYSFGVNTTTGQGYEMDVIAMAVFGGISNIGGKGKMVG
ncbi:MAG: ABC transporter permease, partial [Eubacterium sp.]|nr:ABC transporter permease [Eubacterium sp.]